MSRQLNLEAAAGLLAGHRVEVSPGGEHYMQGVIPVGSVDAARVVLGHCVWVRQQPPFHFGNERSASYAPHLLLGEQDNQLLLGSMAPSGEVESGSIGLSIATIRHRKPGKPTDHDLSETRVTAADPGVMILRESRLEATRFDIGQELGSVHRGRTILTGETQMIDRGVVSLDIVSDTGQLQKLLSGIGWVASS